MEAFSRNAKHYSSQQAAFSLLFLLFPSPAVLHLSRRKRYLPVTQQDAVSLATEVARLLCSAVFVFCFFFLIIDMRIGRMTESG